MKHVNLIFCIIFLSCCLVPNLEYVMSRWKLWFPSSLAKLSSNEVTQYLEMAVTVNNLRPICRITQNLVIKNYSKVRPVSEASFSVLK